MICVHNLLEKRARALHAVWSAKAPTSGSDATRIPALIPWLDNSGAFPPVERAQRRPNGLLVGGGDLSPDRLLRAYRLGIFPWYSEGEPILWWSPDPRMVLFPAEL